MSRNHRNRSWRGQWSVNEIQGMLVANHRNGVVAMVVAGEVLIDTSRFQGTHFLGDDAYLHQARRLFEEHRPEEEPDDLPAPRM